MPVLRIGLINIRGLLSSRTDPSRPAPGGPTYRSAVWLAGLAELHGLDVLVVTETHTRHDRDHRQAMDHLSSTAQSLQGTGWECLSDAPARLTERGGTSGGVVLLARSGLCSQGLLRVVQRQPLQQPDAQVAARIDDAAASGNVTTAHLAWGGHYLHLTGVYMPQQDGAQNELLDGVLGPLRAAAVAAHAQSIFAGDWNFVADYTLDRDQRSRRRPATGGDAQAARLAAACPGLSDAFRRLHPRRKEWTYFQVREEQAPQPGQPPTKKLAASRLDRFYVSDGLLPYVTACGVADRCTVSDHRLVVLRLQARLPSSQGKGLRRMRAHYLRHDELRERVNCFLAAQLDAMPSDPDDPAVAQWWLAFKPRWCGEIAAANAEARARLLDALAGSEAARHARDQAAEALETQQEALAGFAQAQSEWRRARLRKARDAEMGRRRDWLHTREQPNPLITKLVRPPAAKSAIAALRCPRTHALLHAPSALPRVMVEHWADISSAPSPDPAARREVLDALVAHSKRMDPAVAQRAGAAAVCEEEVCSALRRLPPGSASGEDGIPVDLYRGHAEHIAPLLSRLFTAIGTQQAAPPEFLLGAITFIHKKGPVDDPANYRPITLLNADYRILARALATRAGAALDDVISRAQCAFLPERRIGEAVWLLRMIPYWLRAHSGSGLLVFLDFAKAYDTVDRDFLFAAMEAMGAGDGLVGWARTLLTDTRAFALVNGHRSEAVAFTAGVRQGCPLSPLLYLFVAEALLAWLTECGFGIELDGVKVVAGQYADDCSALLRSLSDLRPFEAAMGVFARATGQHVNPSKTQVMKVGWPDFDVRDPATLPYKLAVRVTNLGVSFSNDCSSVPDRAAATAFWQERLAAVWERYEKLRRMPLSAFGRAFAATGYGLGRLLFHMEFAGLPPSAMLAKLTAATARLVDESPGDAGRRRASGEHRRLTGVASVLQPGHPSLGGLGLLPLLRHIRARHLWWAVTFVRDAALAEDRPPWVDVTRAVLARTMPHASPLSLLRPVLPPPGWVDYAADEYWPRNVAVSALRRVPPLRDLAEAVLESGIVARRQPDAAALPLSLARDAPIFGNPLLDVGAGGFTDAKFGDVACEVGPATVQQLWQQMQSPPSPPLPIGPPDRRYRRFEEAQAAYPGRLPRLGAVLPAGWLAQCAAETRSPAAVMEARRQAEAAVLDRCQLDPARDAEHNTSFPLSSVPPVRVLTAMQADMSAVQRARCVRAFLAEACAPRGYTPEQFRRTQAAIWKGVRWELEHLETFWRLPLNGIGIYGMARFRNGAPPLQCWCHAGEAGRLHSFWHCPVAASVVATVQAGVDARFPSTYVSRCSLWLAEPPHVPGRFGIHAGAWHVVALAALEAMERGRRWLTRLCLEAGLSSGAGGRASRAQLQRACVEAVEEFWVLLADFAQLHRTAPRGWGAGALPAASAQAAAHPFFHVLPAAAEGDKPRLALTPRPLAAAATTVVAATLSDWDPGPPAGAGEG